MKTSSNYEMLIDKVTDAPIGCICSFILFIPLFALVLLISKGFHEDLDDNSTLACFGLILLAVVCVYIFYSSLTYAGVSGDVLSNINSTVVLISNEDITMNEKIEKINEFLEGEIINENISKYTRIEKKYIVDIGDVEYQLMLTENTKKDSHRGG